MEIKYIDLKEFIDMGLLLEVNRVFFHPIGLALEIDIVDDGSHFVGGIWDYREDDEGMLFNKLDKEKMDRARRFICRQIARRFKKLGYVCQTKDLMGEKIRQTPGDIRYSTGPAEPVPPTVEDIYEADVSG